MNLWVILLFWTVAVTAILAFNYGAHTYDRSVDPFLNEEKKSE